MSFYIQLVTGFRLATLPWAAGVCVLAMALAAPAHGFVITENFDADPGWESVRNRSWPEDFGFSGSTNLAGGYNPGEVGGTFVRSKQAYYAVDVGQLDPSVETLGWSGAGRIVISSNGNALLAWFDKDSNLSWPPANAIMLRSDGDDLYLRYGANGSGSEVLLQSFVTNPFTFLVNYDPNGNGGTGTITGSINDGSPVTLNLGSGHKDAMENLDRFGLMTLYIPGSGNSSDIYFDDLTFGTESIAPPLPGDFDEDGDVDFADFVILRDGFLASSMLGDMDFDNDVDLVDFRLFKNEYEAINPSSAPLGPEQLLIPEPAALTLMFFGMAAVVLLGLSRRFPLASALAPAVKRSSSQNIFAGLQLKGGDGHWVSKGGGRRSRFETLEPRRVLDSTVVFNEIMFNPPGDDQTLEWIELHNQMALDMDLSGWSLSGDVDFEFPPVSANPQAALVPGGGYLLIAKDPVALAATGVVADFGPYVGQLANQGAQIELRNNNDRLMDVVDYSDDGVWPVAPDGGGFSLAKMDPDTASLPPENWRASLLMGGTPGGHNDPLSFSDLVLTVDTNSGTTSIYNPADEPITFDGYTISSASGSLLPADGNWNSLQDQEIDGGNWFEASPTATNLSELNLAGTTTLGVGESLSIQQPFDPAGQQDLAFEYLVAAGFDRNGIVLYDASLVGLAQVGLRLNEVAPGDGSGFWLEIVNTADQMVALDGLVLSTISVPANEYVFPSQTLAAGGFLSLTELELGFAATTGDKLMLLTPNRQSGLDAVVVDAVSRGRSWQHDGRWLYPKTATPGWSNSFEFQSEIVINEIMYHHRPSLAPFVESDEEWIELVNRGATPVNLTGWKLQDAVNFEFSTGTVIGSGEYLVVAGDAAAVNTKVPSAAVVGDFSGGLNNKSDSIVLTDANGNPADEVHYFDGGRWPEYADGGGASVELRDPDADNSRAEAWVASDETGKSHWNTYTYTGAAQTFVSGSPTGRREFNLGLLTAGELLLDDISVTDLTAGGVELILNSSFESGAADWDSLGNHRHSQVVVDPDVPTNHALHLVARGSTEYQGNEIRTTLANGASIVDGRQYQISYRAKWLSGSNQLNTRLYFNRLPRTTVIDVPSTSGTPGAVNSTFTANMGPTYREFRHGPVVPAAGQIVAVSVAAADLDGVAAVTLWWSANGGGWNNSTTSAGTGGVYTGTIPGQAAGTIVQFYVEGTDTLGASSTFPAAGSDSRALLVVEDGRAMLSTLHNFRILMTTADADFMHDGNVLSNERLGATVVYDERTVFYDVAVRLKGSAVGRGVPWVGFNLRFHPDQLFRGVQEKVAIDRSAHTVIGTDEILVKHIANHAGDIPGMFDDIAYVIAPRDEQTGEGLLQMARLDNVYLDSQFQNGGDGTQYELEGYRFDGYRDVPIRDYGTDTEAYRHHFLITNNRTRDDYSKVVELSQAMSLTGSALDTATQAVMDVDQWMRVLALHTLTGVGDTYPSENHNMRFYVRPEDGKVLMFPWDWDATFGGSPGGGLVTGALSPVANLPANRRLLEGHALDIINTTLNSTYMGYWLNHYGELGGKNYSNILSWISQRSGLVLSALPTQIPFRITSSVDNTILVDANLVSEFALARALVPSGASAIDTVWTGGNETNFASLGGESTWQSGLTGVGYERPGSGTNYSSLLNLDVSAMDGGNNTVYIRVPFTIPSQADIDSMVRLKLKLRFDDGAVVYLNGTKVADRNAPANPIWNSQATNSNSDGNAVVATEIDLSAYLNTLTVGNNILAIQGLNHSSGGPSSDLLILPELIATTPFSNVVNDDVVTINGQGWINVREIRVAGQPQSLDVAWTSETDWVADVPLLFGENVLNFEAYDFQGERINTSASTSITVVSTVSQQPYQDLLQMSELMYHPANPTAAEDPFNLFEDDDFEFIEFYNSGTTQTLDLDGVRITGGPSEEFHFSGSNVTSLGPGEFVLVVRSQSAFEARYGTGLSDQIAGEYTGKLGNGGEEVVVVDSIGFDIHRFTYSDNSPWPAAADGSGPSLVLVNPSADPDHALVESWTTSYATYGSPGAGEPTVYLPGDYNRNGFVDAADYTVYRDTLGSTSDLRADGNDNGSVEIGDYGVWRTNFGLTAAQASAQLIEEPAPLAGSSSVDLLATPQQAIAESSVVIATSLPDVSDNDVAKVLLFARLGEQQPALSKPGVNPPQVGLEFLDQQLSAGQDQLAILAHDEVLGSLRIDERRDDGTLQDGNGVAQPEGHTGHISFDLEVDESLRSGVDLDLT